MHDLYFQYFSDRIESRIFITGMIFRLLYLRHDISIRIIPHRAIPAILQIIDRISQSGVEGFKIMHITGKHIRVQILHRLEMPVLATPPIIIKINPHLDYF